MENWVAMDFASFWEFPNPIPTITPDAIFLHSYIYSFVSDFTSLNINDSYYLNELLLVFVLYWSSIIENNWNSF
jgi:hypothetical protein